MTSIRRIVEISGTLAALLLAVMAIQAWLAKHDDKLRMQATIAAQKQLLDAADARERDRDGALKDTLAQIESLKRSVQTPAEILRDLPKYLALPQPITMLPSGAPASRGERGDRRVRRSPVYNSGRLLCQQLVKSSAFVADSFARFFAR